MNKIVAITGTSASGKDYLVDLINISSEIKKYNMGTMISEKLNTHRDLMMKKFSKEGIYKTQQECYSEVANAQPSILICHAVRKIDNKYTYDLRLEKILKPIYYIFVRSDPSEISNRIIQRNQKNGRITTAKTPDEINRIQKYEIIKTKEMCKIIGSKLIEIDNNTLDTKVNIIKIEKLIEELRVI